MNVDTILRFVVVCAEPFMNGYRREFCSAAALGFEMGVLSSKVAWVFY